MIYYYIIFISSDSQLNKKWGEKWDLTNFETVANLVVGDVINFREKEFSDELEKDFKTKEFLISKRIFFPDSDFENEGGNFHLFLQPVIN